ncbi:hypothetical protein BC826DRAFT_391639 [Russula brevipes]|nr:hypothetical protein BC826DRAFT_391639 [Russula brevipes]
MNKLHPGSIEWIHPLEDGMLRTSNVTKFINSCFAHGLPPEDVFLYDDLIDATPDSSARVARTIIALVKLTEKSPSTHSLLLQSERDVELDKGSSILPPRSRVTSGAGDSPHLRSLGLSADSAITRTTRDQPVSPPIRSWSISSSRRNQSATPPTMNLKDPPSMKNQPISSFSKNRTISPSTKDLSPSTNMSTSPSPDASPNLSPLAFISANISPSPNMFTSPLPNPLMAPDLVDTSISKSVRLPRMSWRRIRQIFSLPARHPGISETPHANPVLHSVGGHSFVDATFRKPVICRVCMGSMRKAAALCSRCCLVAHSKCLAHVPWGCNT